MWHLWWTKRHWDRFPPSTSVSPANHSSNISIIIITRGWHNRPISGRSAEWTQLDSTPHYTNLKIQSATGSCNTVIWRGVVRPQTVVSVSPHLSCKFHFTPACKIMNSAMAYDLLCVTFARISRFYIWFMNNPLFSPKNYYKSDEKLCVYVTKTTD
jgi:hypothetical protein